MAKHSVETLKDCRFEGFGLSNLMRKKLCTLFNVEYEPTLVEKIGAVKGISAAKAKILALEPIDRLKKRAFGEFELSVTSRLELCSLFGVEWTFPTTLQDLGFGKSAIDKITRRFFDEKEVTAYLESASVDECDLPGVADLCRAFAPHRNVAGGLRKDKKSK